MQPWLRVMSIWFVLAFGVWALACEPETDDDDDDHAADDDLVDNADPYTGPDDDSDGQLGHDARENELLWRFRPLVIQQLPAAEPIYNPWYDHLGQVELRYGDSLFPYEVNVNWHVHAIYTTARQILLGGARHRQLYYYLFYAYRPVTVREDDPLYGFRWLGQYLYSGPVDGKVVRVTLDQEEVEPLFIEEASLAGTEYKLFVSNQIESQVRDEFEDAGQTFDGLARPGGPGERWFEVLPEAVFGATIHPVVVLAPGYDQGYHRVLAAYTSYEQFGFYYHGEFEAGLIYTDADWYLYDDFGLERTDYALLRYEDLLRLPPAGGEEPIGIYDRWGKIWNAYTPFALPFYEQDLAYFPGTPGEPDAVRVIWERYSLEDPALIDKIIYLPEAF